MCTQSLGNEPQMWLGLLRCTCFQLSLQLSNPEQKPVHAHSRWKSAWVCECVFWVFWYLWNGWQVNTWLHCCIFFRLNTDVPFLPNPPSFHLTCKTLHLQGIITTLLRWNTLTQNTQSSHRIKHGSKKSPYSSVTISNKLVVTAPGLSLRGSTQNIAQMLPTPAIACERVVGKGSVGSEIISAGK